MKKIKKYDLPEWAFLDAHTHLGDLLHLRTVLLHVRSATVIEIFSEFDLWEVTIDEKSLSYDFEFENIEGVVEKQKAVVHYSATLHVINDASYIIDNILKSCADFYSKYSTWEDTNMASDEVSKLN